MSDFHYVRSPGDDGGVGDAGQGTPPGRDLASILQAGLPPWNISIELIAALCEVLDIAEEDRAIHGDIHPGHVFIDERGNVAIGGFGRERSRSPAPEGTPIGTATDRYGLGYTAMRLLSPLPLPHPLKASGPDDHEDQVLDAVLGIDLTGLPPALRGDVQWFVAKLLSHAPEDRPTALETWRTFVAFAHELEGPTIHVWSKEAMNGRGDRRVVGTPDPIPDEVATEELRVASRSKGPDLPGQFSIDGNERGDSSTAFFDRNQFRVALDAPAKAADKSSGGPPQGAGGGAVTTFWSREELEAMEQGKDDAPRPRRTRVVKSSTRARRRPRASEAPTMLRPFSTPENGPNSGDDKPKSGPNSKGGPRSGQGHSRPSRASKNSKPQLSRADTLRYALIAGIALGTIGLMFTVGLLGLVIFLFAGPGARTTDAPIPSTDPPTVDSVLVEFMTSAQGQISGCTTQPETFNGPLAFYVPVSLLPAQCVVTVGTQEIRFQVRGAGRINCENQNDALRCDKPQVGQ